MTCPKFPKFLASNTKIGQIRKFSQQMAALTQTTLYFLHFKSKVGVEKNGDMYENCIQSKFELFKSMLKKIPEFTQNSLWKSLHLWLLHSILTGLKAKHLKIVVLYFFNNT